MPQDKFYLEKIIPDADTVFSHSYKIADEIKYNCIYVLDTNVLLVPYLSSKESIDDFARLFKLLKDSNRLFIPARVAREFARNRGQKIADTYSKLVESKNRLNNAQITLEKFPIFETNRDYQELKEIERKISILKEEYRTKLEKLSDDLMNWKWDDPVSNMYKEIFTAEIIIEVKKSEDELKKDHDFRNDHLIPPGVKKNDQLKPDNGIGDLIIWQTALEIGKEKDNDVILVTNEEHNDWFYRQQNTAVLPRYELLNELREYTNGKSVGILNFSKFLSLLEANDATIAELSELKILEAKYFTSSASLDATSKLQSLVIENTLDTIANNDLVGDPQHGVVKTLRIKYTVGNEVYEKEYGEGDLVHLP
jgi:hypothetical protein